MEVEGRTGGGRGEDRWRDAEGGVMEGEGLEVGVRCR